MANYAHLVALTLDGVTTTFESGIEWVEPEPEPVEVTGLKRGKETGTIEFELTIPHQNAMHLLGVVPPDENTLRDLDGSWLWR